MRHLASTTQGMVIHQYHFSVTPGDAVTNQLFFINRSLQSIGITSNIYADHIRGGLSKWVSRFNDLELWNCDLMLLHHSHGNPMLPKLLQIEVPKALVYHNITPENYFRHDPLMWNLCRVGRRQLTKLRQSVVSTFADSKFNAMELKNLGFNNPILLPLFDLKLKMAESSALAPKTTKKHVSILFVGKIAAHKNQIALVRTLSYLPSGYHLTLVGSADPVYLDYVKLTARALGLLGRIHFTGKVTDSELHRHYRDADAFVSLSLHEGFGVPLIEAMIHEVPVFALNSGATAETLGGAGVTLETDKPWEVAHILMAFLKPLPIKVINQGQVNRLKRLEHSQSEERVRTICRDLVHHLRVVPECEWKSEAETIAKQFES